MPKHSRDPRLDKQMLLASYKLEMYGQIIRARATFGFSVQSIVYAFSPLSKQFLKIPVGVFLSSSSRVGGAKRGQEN